MTELAYEMIRYYSGDLRRIEHFLKVYAYAKAIAEGEGVDEYTRLIIETAALTHDIGIKVSEEKYGSSNGRYQELEGPAAAREMLLRIGFGEDVIERVCWLIAHHHTYDNIDSADYQILVEADFLVNLSEDKSSPETVRNVRSRIFKTKTGTDILDAAFGKEVIS